MQSFRSYIRRAVLNVLSIRSIPNKGIHILNGHFLSLDNTRPSVVFKNLIDKLLENNVIIINFQEAVRRISLREFPSDKCFVAFTFDDGFEECFTKIAPVLNNINISAGFFINPAFVGCNEEYRQKFLNEIVFTKADKKPLTWTQVKELYRQGHVIGSHTMDHYCLDGFDENYEYQIVASKNIIEEQLKCKCDYFAYTYGGIRNFSEKALSIASLHHKYIFSQDDYRNYFSFDGRVINRRHFECDWPFRHVLYFLKKKETGL